MGLREVEAAVLHALIQKNICHKDRHQALAQDQGGLHWLAQLHAEDDALGGEEHHAADTAQPHQRPGQEQRRERDGAGVQGRPRRQLLGEDLRDEDNNVDPDHHKGAQAPDGLRPGQEPAWEQQQGAHRQQHPNQQPAAGEGVNHRVERHGGADDDGTEPKYLHLVNHCVIPPISCSHRICGPAGDGPG